MSTAFLPADRPEAFASSAIVVGRHRDELIRALIAEGFSTEVVLEPAKHRPGRHSSHADGVFVARRPIGPCIAAGQANPRSSACDEPPRGVRRTRLRRGSRSTLGGASGDDFGFRDRILVPPGRLRLIEGLVSRSDQPVANSAPWGNTAIPIDTVGASPLGGPDRRTPESSSGQGPSRPGPAGGAGSSPRPRSERRAATSRTALPDAHDGTARRAPLARGTTTDSGDRQPCPCACGGARRFTALVPSNTMAWRALATRRLCPRWGEFARRITERVSAGSTGPTKQISGTCSQRTKDGPETVLRQNTGAALRRCSPTGGPATLRSASAAPCARLRRSQDRRSRRWGLPCPC